MYIIQTLSCGIFSNQKKYCKHFVSYFVVIVFFFTRCDCIIISPGSYHYPYFCIYSPRGLKNKTYFIMYTKKCLICFWREKIVLVTLMLHYRITLCITCHHSSAPQFLLVHLTLNTVPLGHLNTLIIMIMLHVRH